MSVLGAASTIDAFETFLRQVDKARDTVVIVGTNVEYAAFVELGTSQMRAQPYLFPATQKVAANPSAYIDDPDSLDEFIEQVGLAIEGEAKKLAPVDTGRLQNSIEAEKIRG